MEEVKQLEYDSSWTQVDPNEYIELSHCIGTVAYSKYSYVARKYRNGLGDKFYYLLRIIESKDIDGDFSFFIAPAFKPTDDMAIRLVLPTVKNKLNLEKGVPPSVDDLPKPKLDFTNSVYDAKQKRRVPIIPLANNEEPTEKIKNVVEPKKNSTVGDGLINNQDVKEDGKSHSSDFLPPHVCTRLWVLNMEPRSDWAWFWKQVDGVKHKMEYYCRPYTIGQTFDDIQYDRGGAMVSVAFRKIDFPELDNEVLSHENIRRIMSEFNDTKKQEINCIIDSFLIKWR